MLKPSRFLYSFQYSLEDESYDDSNYSEVNDRNERRRKYMHAHMFALGDKYQIDCLKEHAKEAFCSDFCDVDFSPESWVELVELVYSSTPKSTSDLKKVLLSAEHPPYVDANLTQYRKYVKDTEAFLDYTSDVLHQAVLEAKRSADQRARELKWMRPCCARCKEITTMFIVGGTIWCRKCIKPLNMNGEPEKALTS